VKTDEEARTLIDGCINTLEALAVERGESLIFVYAARIKDSSAAEVNLGMYGKEYQLFQLVDQVLCAIGESPEKGALQ
jgi:hypothetical protein